MLSASVIGAFEREAGLDDDAKLIEMGLKFRDTTVLAQGGSQYPMDIFVEFRGREPSCGSSEASHGPPAGIAASENNRAIFVAREVQVMKKSLVGSSPCGLTIALVACGSEDASESANASGPTDVSDASDPGDAEDIRRLLSKRERRSY